MDQVSAQEQTTLEEVALWEAGLETLHSRIAPIRPAVTAPTRPAYLKGLLGPVEHKNGW
jgi:hypothetical protein